MEETRKGWVIVNFDHPNNPGVKRIYPETFGYTRKDSIAKFINGSGSTWRYWYRKYNFRAMKCEMTIIV
tara:strand:+ start:879 stop:1085 length:207 start_codon:yes stop_codon:yes gene_type:complete